jgi:general stress protein YciG
MDAEKQREIARKGGRAAHEKGTAHEFTADEARAAGRKGGERVSANRDHMSRIGRLGGKMSAGRRQGSAMPQESLEESSGAMDVSNEEGDSLGAPIDRVERSVHSQPEANVGVPPAAHSG